MDPAVLRLMIEEDEFGMLVVPPRAEPKSTDERLVDGFREITDFVIASGREPERNPANMTETRLAMRLQAIRDSDEQRTLLLEHDELDLLRGPEPPASVEEALAADDSGLLTDAGADLLAPKHVPKRQTMPAKIARRKPCPDFEKFEPLFQRVQQELRGGERRLLKFRNPKDIHVGSFFVLNGVLLYVASMGERKLDNIKKANARLRCIFENGTESDLLLQSLASNLYKDGKRVTEPTRETLEAMGLAPNTPMATVYVVRSLSSDPQLTGIPDVYKIGSTRQDTPQRVAGAATSTTFLGAPVEVIAEYRVPAGTEKRIEGLLHRIFAAVRLDAYFEKDGVVSAEANEWFSVPLEAIDDAIGLIQSEAITNYAYEPASGAFELRG